MNNYLFDQYVTGEFIYVPHKVRALEIWHFGTETPVVICHDLDGEEIVPWLNKSTPTTKGEAPVAGLRLLLDIHTRTGLRVVPFAQDVFAEIIYQFNIPRCLPKSLQRESFAHFVKFSPETLQDGIQQSHSSGFILRTPSDSTADWTFGFSYDPGSGITRGVMLGLLNERNLGDRLVDTIVRMAHMASHPMLVPFVIALHRMEATDERLNIFYNNVVGIEKMLGHHSEVNEIDPTKVDFMTLTKRLSLRGREADVCEERVELLLALVRGIIEYSQDPAIRTALCGARRVCTELQECVKYIQCNGESMRLLASLLQRRVQRQMTIVYNFMAQRDNHLNIGIAKGSHSVAKAVMRDSTSMKAIALLTMLFLPMTFVSTLFSVPMFHWNLKSGEDFVTGNFWIYWVVSLPLTAIVVMIWSLWTRYEGSKARIVGTV